MSNGPDRPALRALTGLRFFAAAAVVFHHFGRELLPAGPLRNVAAGGFVGVDLFFILSGFVLVYAYRVEEVRVDVRTFLVARVARILPLYMLGLVLAAPPYFSDLAERHAGEDLAWRLIASLGLHATMTHAWVGHVGIWNVPDWSLSSEWFFYVVFPWIVPPIVRSRSLLRLLGIGTALLLAGLSVAWAHHVWRPEWIDASNDGTHLGGLLKYGPFGRIHEFLIGAILARVWQLARPFQHTGILATVSGGAALVLLAFAPSLPLLPLGNGLLAPFFALLVLALAEGGGWLGRLLGTRPIVRLGDASYGIYILHWPVAWWFIESRAVLGGPRDLSGPTFLLYFAVVVALSVLAFDLIEAPLRRLIRWRFTVAPAT